MADKKVFPMIAESSWWAIRSQFQKTIPSTVNVSYLKSLLSLTSNQSARNIISPLRQMRIIDEDGKPTPRANEWRSDNKYAEVCHAIITEIYPDELNDLFPDSSVDTTKVKTWFMDIGAVGESAASKITATYVLLRQAQIKTDIPSKAGTSNDRKGSDKGKPSSRAAKSTPSVSSGIMPDCPIPDTTALQPTVHIDLQIHVSPDASAEQIDKIFESIAKHLYGRG